MKRKGLKALGWVIGIAWILGATAPVWANPSATAHVQVSVTIPARVKLEINTSTLQVTLTPEDIERGYVDLPGATQVKLWTNSRRGTNLMVRPSSASGPNGGPIPLDSFLYRVQGDGGFRPLQEGDQVAYQGKGIEVGTSKALDYRIKVGWGMMPGTYRLDLIYTAVLNE